MIIILNIKIRQIFKVLYLQLRNNHCLAPSAIRLFYSLQLCYWRDTLFKNIIHFFWGKAEMLFSNMFSGRNLYLGFMVWLSLKILNLLHHWQTIPVIVVHFCYIFLNHELRTIRVLLNILTKSMVLKF